MNRYRWFQLTQNYHNAMFTMLFEIEQAITREYHFDMDDEYLIQTVRDAVKAAETLLEFETVKE